MSWIGGSLVIDSFDKKSVSMALSEISSIVRHNADLEEFPNMGNDVGPIKLISTLVCDNYDKAEEFLEERRNKWSRNYDAAVAFRDTSNVKPTKKLENLQARLKVAEDKAYIFSRDSDIKNFKAALIGCPKCGSKIAKKYVVGNHCPLCNEDLRSETTKKTFEKYIQNIHDIEKLIEDEKGKNKEKLPIKYLVMYEEYIG